MDQQDVESLIIVEFVHCDQLFSRHSVCTQRSSTTTSAKFLDVLLPLLSCKDVPPGRDLVRPLFLVSSGPHLDLDWNLVNTRHWRGLVWIKGRRFNDWWIERRVFAGMVVRHEIAHECMLHGLISVVVSIFYPIKGLCI